MLFRSKKTKKNVPQRGVLKGNRPGGRLCRLEPLEERRMLAAWGALFLLAKRGIHDSRRECPTRNEEVMR